MSGSVNLKAKALLLLLAVKSSSTLADSPSNEALDPELLAYLGGWEVAEGESYTPLEWVDMLEALEIADDSANDLADSNNEYDVHDGNSRGVQYEEH